MTIINSVDGTKLSYYMNESDLRSDVHYLGSSENKAWKKNSGLYGIWTHDLWPEFFSGLIFTTA